MEKMVSIQELSNFLATAARDVRISARHISLYTSLWILWKEKGKDNKLIVFSHQVIDICKISSISTYHKTIKQLHEFGYIIYAPSFNHFTGSTIEFK